ncbi:hypothetical protein [Brachyspira murdochii]|uniref:hypothetical protein n=1 Tax=Brachyspira murdochii TaxID=84378 RepID=UPI003006ED81
MVLENLYYTEFYKNHWLKYGILFEDEYFQKEKKTILNDDYYIIHKKYTGFIHNKDIIGYDRTLYKKDELIYNYKSDDSRMYKIIKHTDNYFIFNRDLSGFSILDLNNQNNIFNFYHNKPLYNNNQLNGIWVFIDFEYYNNQILFYGFYITKEENGAYKRIFDYMLYSFSNNIFKSQNYINIVSIRQLIFDKYNHNLYFTYNAYFKEDNIIIEDSFNNKTFALKYNNF